MSFVVPVLPRTAAALRFSPGSFARCIGDMLNARLTFVANWTEESPRRYVDRQSETPLA